MNQLSIEDLRILINQGIGLKYLLPLAIDKLKINILAEGDLFEGDLLEAIRKIKAEFWIEFSEHAEQINGLIARNAQMLAAKFLNNKPLDY
ncbi:hypothetical protein AHMF7616_04330 [Adhaeribacter pallidiroseus]|uniref:Uncharacterized protein n=1 Tax=Adhaeribacter pallidiroseus TaxID=2072847 RepID=A0A369QMX1_9BACT|nr:hypothetical protein AHMF7616_04330 [Adhaeribacter pallidiroseus]